MLFSAFLAIAHLAHCCALFHLVEQPTIAHHAHCSAIFHLVEQLTIAHFTASSNLSFHSASALFFSDALLTNAVNCILQTGKMLKHDSTVFIVWQFHLTIAHQELHVTPNYHWLVWPALKRLWLCDTKSSLCSHYHDHQQIHSKISFNWWGIFNIIIPGSGGNTTGLSLWG